MTNKKAVWAIVMGLVLVAVGCSEKKKKPAKQTTRATGSSTPTPVEQERPSTPKREVGVRLDKDGNEKPIARSEIKSKQLDSYDTDRDGRFSKEEQHAMVVKRVERTFAEFDKDQDGKLTRAELAATRSRFGVRLERRFQILDKNSDGAVTAEEMTKQMTRRLKDRKLFQRGRPTKSADQ